MNLQRDVWVVEDSPEDYEALQAAAQAIKFSANIRHFIDGESLLIALNRLSANLGGTGTGWPCLLLLDLNLPGIDGKDVLKKLKRTQRKTAFPVVVFSTSSRSQEIAACYELGANAYVVKPMGLDLLEKMLRSLGEFWLHHAVLPDG